MIGPKKRRSRSKKRQQKHMWMTKQIKKLHARMNLAPCNNCGETKHAHRVCRHCGWYKGEQVLTISSGSDENVMEA